MAGHYVLLCSFRLPQCALFCTPCIPGQPSHGQPVTQWAQLCSPIRSWIHQEWLYSHADRPALWSHFLLFSWSSFSLGYSGLCQADKKQANHNKQQQKQTPNPQPAQRVNKGACAYGGTSRKRELEPEEWRMARTACRQMKGLTKSAERVMFLGS